MSCGHCKDRIEKALAKLKIEKLKISLEDKTVKVATDRDPAELTAAMEEAGYPAVLI